ncbi:hypothetical protein OGAPHI_003552 [Ogataea philodendri]|uniref:Uncharacterized protein n=1 Tax=Ogataea philodendri TaxID=1378263 RepID=A0A9P8P6E8_9ASCO|nr:uncharacterized protein OGAPHI_003552 [Ogataea philodendri]KAH3666373.1 hypothetical protein OGAPHI_003552 [Ogataea philodendri]
MAAVSFLSFAFVEVPWNEQTPRSSIVKSKVARAPLIGAIRESSFQNSFPYILCASLICFLASLEISLERSSINSSLLKEALSACKDSASSAKSANSASTHALTCEVLAFSCLALYLMSSFGDLNFEFPWYSLAVVRIPFPGAGTDLPILSLAVDAMATIP